MAVRVDRHESRRALTHGKLRTCVGSGSTSVLEIPSDFSTLVPVGKPLGKFKTPELTNPEILLSTSVTRLPASLLMSSPRPRRRRSTAKAVGDGASSIAALPTYAVCSGIGDPVGTDQPRALYAISRKAVLIFTGRLNPLVDKTRVFGLRGWHCRNKDHFCLATSPTKGTQMRQPLRLGFDTSGACLFLQAMTSQYRDKTGLTATLCARRE